MDKKFIIKLSVILFLITAVCVCTLAVCNNITKDTIEKINIENQENAKKEVLKEATSFEVSKTDKDVFIGKNGDKIIGYAVSVSPKGFGGNMDMMVGITPDLKVCDISIVNISETPGLGSKANDKKFLGQYKDLTENIAVKKGGGASGNEICAISGATVTSKAVTDGVNDAILKVKKVMEVEKWRI